MASVTVRGRAAADVDPDRVRLTVAVQAEAATGGDALALLAARAERLDAALAAAGDLVLLRRPDAVSLTPSWSPTGEVTGQAARRSVTLEAAAGGPLGELLGALVAVPGSTVERTEWLVDPGNPAHGRVRAAAVTDARGRAADYAAAAGLRLGAVEAITEPEATAEPGLFEAAWVPQAARAKDAGGGPVLELRPEPVPVTAAVQVRYALLAGSDD